MPTMGSSDLPIQMQRQYNWMVHTRSCIRAIGHHSVCKKTRMQCLLGLTAVQIDAGCDDFCQCLFAFLGEDAIFYLVCVV